MKSFGLRRFATNFFQIFVLSGILVGLMYLVFPQDIQLLFKIAEFIPEEWIGVLSLPALFVFVLLYLGFWGAATCGLILLAEKVGFLKGILR